MQIEFKKAVQHQDPQDVIISTELPFIGLEVPDFLCNLYQAIIECQQKRGVDVISGFAFGGQFADMAVGRTPNDYDVYICSPDWVELVQGYNAECGKVSGYKEMHDLMEDREIWVFGSEFPFSSASNNFKILNSSPLGNYFEFNGSFYDQEGKQRVIDVKIGSKAVEMADFITYFSAPIMAAAQSLSGKNSVAYHRYFEDDTKAQVLCTNNPSSPDLQEKARRKGLRIITPSLRPFNFGRQGHQDGLGVATGSETKLGAPIIK